MFSFSSQVVSVSALTSIREAMAAVVSVVGGGSGGRFILKGTEAWTRV